MLALLTLVLASSPSTRSLGVQAASGLVVAAVFVLLVLPPLLGLFGRRLFWPFVPQRRRGTPYRQRRLAPRRRCGGAQARSSRGGRRSPGSSLLCTGLLTTPVGLSQTEQFRVQAESVSGYETLAAHFPSGLTDPTRVIAPDRPKAAEIEQAITATPGVVSANPAGASADGLSQWSVVLSAEPASDEAFKTIDALRDSVHAVDPGALVGGSDAQARDASAAAARDRLVIIPAILAVVLIVLYVLLRSALAPLVLVAVTVLSALAALGLGGWASVHLFGFPALDNTAPLFAFLFLVALGVDYTIFLVTRAREETPEHGTREGIVRAVSATGAVITSAGIVLAAVFCVLGVLPLIVLTQVGIIVGLGILLDTFVVRTVIIPALFTLIGPRIWWPALRAMRLRFEQWKDTWSTPCWGGCGCRSRGSGEAMHVLAQPADDRRHVGGAGRPLRATVARSSSSTRRGTARARSSPRPSTSPTAPAASSTFWTGSASSATHFVGNSWGGMIGGTFAATYPDRIGSAVLMNCTASPAGTRQKIEYGLLLRMAKLIGGIRPPLTRSVLKAFLGPTTFRHPARCGRVRAGHRRGRRRRLGSRGR